MKKIKNFAKKAIAWYFNQYAKCYDDRYCRYAYRY